MRKALIWFLELVVVLTAVTWLDTRGYIAAIPTWVIVPGAAILLGLLVWYDHRSTHRNE